MTLKMQKVIGVLMLVLGVGYSTPASAQTNFVRLWPNGTTSQTIDADTETVDVTNAIGMATMGVQVTGTFTGTLTPQCTIDGTNWVAVPTSELADTTPSPSATITTTGVFVGSITGCESVRVIGSGWSMGAAIVTINTIETGGGAGGASAGTFEGEVTVDAQPASDPHFVRCSNSSVASPCLVGDGSGALTVDGTVTVTDGAGALNVIVDSGVITATVTDGAGALNVIIDSAPTLTVQGTVTVTATDLDVQSGGADLATAAAQSTANTSLSTIAGDTSDIEVSVELLDNVLGPVAAGTATATAAVVVGAQYNLTPPTFTDGQQGSLQLTSAGALVVSGGGGGTEYTVNAAAPANPTGGAPLAERTDTLATLNEADGEWANLRTNNRGAQWVAVDGTVTVGDGSGALNVIIDSSAALTVGDGSGALNVIVDSGTLTTVSTVTTVSAVTAITNALPAGNNNVGDVDVATIAAGDTDIGNVDLEFAGTAASTNNGAVDAQTLRVTLANNSTGIVALTTSSATIGVLAAGNNNIGDVDVATLPSVTIGTFPDNEPINVAQVNGVTVLMGNGATGTGSQRVTLANDNTVPTGWPTAALQSTANTSLDSLDNAVSGAGFNITQLAGATTPMTTTQADDALNTLDGLNVTSFGLMFDGSTWDRIRGDSSNGLLVNLGTNNDVTVTSGAITLSANSGVDVGDVTLTAGSADIGNVNLEIGGTAITAGSGSVGATTPRVVLATDDPAVASLATHTTALQIIDNIVNTLGSTTSGQSGVLGLGAVTTAAPSYTTAQTNALSLTTAGSLRVEVTNASSGGVAHADDADFTAGTTQFTPAGGFYQSTVTACTDGDQCAIGITAQRTVKTTLYSAAGSELTPSLDVTEDAAESAGGTGPMILGVRRDVAAASTATSGDNATFNTDSLGLMWSRHLDPCSGVAKTVLPINIATATTTEITAALAGASTHYYVCAINLVAAAAQTIAFADDDSDGCGSVTAGMNGGITAATGWSFAANGGIALGNGSSTVLKTNGTNRVICAVTGQAAQLSGTMVVVAAP